ncbi:MAG: hypothetical protein Q9173_004614 [Seirophora scorigena]
MSNRLSKRMSSTIARSGEPDLVTLPDGSTGTKVTIRNFHPDGLCETKEFVQKLGESFEEMANTRTLMTAMLSKVAVKPQDSPKPISETFKEMGFGHDEDRSIQSLDV